MKNKLIWLSFIFLLVASMLLASCTSSTTTSTSKATTTSTSVSTTTKTVTPITTSSAPTTTSTSAAAGNWWDKLGIPQYGGTMTLRYNKDPVSFDPYNVASLGSIEFAYYEKMFADNWTSDQSTYWITFRPTDLVKGNLAQSWEFADPNTFVVHLRQGIHWQNIAPANGREFIADDVVAHFDRLYGLGNGYTTPSPGQAASLVVFSSLISVTSTDKYTVAFKWKISNPELILENLMATNTPMDIECPDAVKQWGNVNDWHHAIGTGPFILTDFVDGSSATFIRNTNYWAHDERYPQNQLPYLDGLKVLVIVDNATALAALRTGKIDIMDSLSLSQVQSVQKTNPQILQISIPASSAESVDPKNDVKPYNDIRVRQAMQMAIDLPTIAKTYYGGAVSPNPSTLTSNYMQGWGFPYDQWPQDLKDQYAYNPTAAKQLLAAAGFPTGFNTDIVCDANGDLDLIQIVKSYFAAVGINMEIRVLDSASWAAFVQQGHHQDALAYRTLMTLGATFDPFHMLTTFLSTYANNFKGTNDPTVDGYYTQAYAATSIDGLKQIIKDLNIRVAQQHFSVSLLQPLSYSLYQPWLKGYDSQIFGISGGGAGAQLLFFYSARFWIDQNMKKSMGY